MVVALGGEEAKEILPAPFRVFEVPDGIQIVKSDLFQKTLFGGWFVEGEEVGAENKEEGLPLLWSTVSGMHVFRVGGAETLVFRVRLCTSPLRSTRSKAKLPFWLTGEKVSRLRCPFRTPAVFLGNVADGGAAVVAECLVSIGCGMALDGVKEFFGLAGNTSAMFDKGHAEAEDSHLWHFTGGLRGKRRVKNRFGKRGLTVFEDWIFKSPSEAFPAGAN